MAYRYLIYSTGTTYSGTILRESAINNPGVGEASLYSNFVIPAIQPLYLWQVSGINVIPNTDTKISNYQTQTAPPPQPNDAISYGQTTGLTNQKISKFVGVTANIPLIASSGNALSDSGLSIPQLTGLTTYTFTESGGTTIKQTGNHLTIFSAPPTGTTVYWGNVCGNINNQTDLQNEFNTKVNKVTGVTNNIGIFDAGGNVVSASKCFTTTVRGTGTATNGFVPTELAVRNAITQAVTAAIILQGDWNATTNVPNLTSGGTGSGYTTGYAWRVGTSGTTALGGLTPWRVGDMAIKVAQAPGWVKVQSQDIAAIWGNISGSISWQTDLWHILTGTTAATASVKANAVTGATNLGSGNGTIYTSCSGNKLQFKTLSGGTNITLTCNGNYIGINSTGEIAWTGSTPNGVGTYVDATHICSQPNMTFDGSSLSVSGNIKASDYVCSPVITGSTSVLTPIVCAGSCVRSPLLSGETLSILTCATVPTPSANNNSTCVATTGWYFGQSGNTAPVMDGSATVGTSPKWAHQDHVHPSDTTKLNVSTFTGYTASTKNDFKKIQLISTGVTNVNTVIAGAINWDIVSYSANTYLYSGGTAIWIKNAAKYEVQYHVTLLNDSANQTHSIGAYIVKNNTTTIFETATSTMVVGSNSGGELSLPPVVLTLANNDRLDLTVFRIGNAGTVNTVNGSVYIMINELT
jgi:hypothetical protein